MPSRKDIQAMKSLNRELKDIQDNLILIKIENVLIDKEIECNEELLQNEMARNSRAKQRLQEMIKLADEEKNKSERLAQACFNMSKGSLKRSVRFSAGKLDELKEASKIYKASLEKKLNDQIESYVRCNRSPSVYLKYIRDGEVQQAKDERTFEKISEELKALKSSNRSARKMSDGMFQLNVLDLSSNILRYRSLMDQLKNPIASKVARGTRMRMFTPIDMSRLPSPVVSSEAGGNGNQDPIVPQIASSSKCQEELDTDEDPEAMTSERSVFEPRSRETDETFEQGSFLRPAMRMKKSAANMVQCSPTENTKRLTEQGAKTARPSITHNARDETKKNEEVAAERPKQPGSMEAPTGQSNPSQKTKKAKVTFQGVQSEFSDQEMDSSKDEGASSADFHVKALANMTISEDSPDIEDPILSENDEFSADNRNEDQPSSDNEMDLNQDDDLDDQIPDWTSLDPSEMNASDGGSLSPVPNFEDMFKEMDEGDNDNATGQQQSSGNDDFQFDFDNDADDGNFDFFK